MQEDLVTVDSFLRVNRYISTDAGLSWARWTARKTVVHLLKSHQRCKLARMFWVAGRFIKGASEDARYLVIVCVYASVQNMERTRYERMVQ